jgi:GntR family transcriptional regulator, transcriptional repressor for pyruvate dehydrogenase complex
MKITRVKQQTVVAQVMNQIKELIASGQFKPYDRIPTEADLAKTFGIGRSSIREAIKIFHHLGIMESRTKTGTFINDASHISTEALTWSILLGKGDLYEIVDLREIIEQKALSTLTELAAHKPKQAQPVLDDLALKVAAMEAATRAARLNALIQADYDFHGVIIGSSGNALFMSIYATLRSFMFEEIKKTNLLETERSAMVREHRAILNAILSGDTQKVLRAFARHIETTRRQLRQSEKTGKTG